MTGWLGITTIDPSSTIYVQQCVSVLKSTTTMTDCSTVCGRYVAEHTDVDVDCDGRSSRQDWEIVVKRGRIDDWKWTSNNSAK